MIRFFRNLILTIIVLAAVGYGAVWFFADKIVDRTESVLTRAFIAGFGPSKEDRYGYKVSLHFWPPTAEVTGLYLDSPALNVDGDLFRNCRLSVDRIVCDLIPILRNGEVKIKSVEGRKFSGLLSKERLAQRIERTGGPISNLVVDLYGRKARLRGRFGSVSIVDITILGDWGIGDRGVATLVDREYLNPDGPVPEGAVRMLEEQVSFDVRIHLLDEELTPDRVSFSSAGLDISAHG